jgi:hypothetical protein
MTFLQIRVPPVPPAKLLRINRDFKKYIFDGLEEAAVKLEDLISFNAMGRVIGPVTGNLGRSIKSKVREAGNITTLTISSDVVYSRIQDLGGWAGRNHASYIKPSRYWSREFDNNFVLKTLEKKMAELFK